MLCCCRWAVNNDQKMPQWVSQDGPASSTSSHQAQLGGHAHHSSASNNSSSSGGVHSSHSTSSTVGGRHAREQHSPMDQTGQQHRRTLRKVGKIGAHADGHILV